MQRTMFCQAALAALFCLGPLVSQAGNEVLFVGSSTSGSTDQHVFAASATGAVLVANGSGFTDNVSGAVWSDTGRRLYVSQSLASRVVVADWDGQNPSWSTLFTASGPCYGVERDAARSLVWTLAPDASGSRQLFGLDADLGSPFYGQVVAQTASLTNSLRERWSLSLSGNVAAVPKAILGTLDVVDLDPASSSYLQVIASSAVPGATGFAFAVDAQVSTDDRFVYLLYMGVGQSAVSVYDVATGAFLDFSSMPGTQDFQLPLDVASSMDVALDGSFLIVAGKGGPGWIGRLDFDYANPQSTTFTPWPNLAVPDADGVSLSPDFSRVAVTSTASSFSAPSKLTICDVATGAQLQSVTLHAMWNVYTTAWQDASPVASYQAFGLGCSGSSGAPTLAAQPGSRPALGQTLTLSLDGLPLDGALVATGLSATATSAGLPLPLDLSVIGMSGCSQLVDAQVIDFVAGAGGAASWTWTLPSQPSLFGAVFYNQAFAIDPAANAFGWTVTNGGVGTVGF